MPKNFQSYLIVGEPDSRNLETKKLVQKFGVDLKKATADLSIISPSPLHITIDQVRTLKKHIFEKPLTIKCRFTIIRDAQKLTPEAQNALLKILEEPPKHAVIILEAQDKVSLLPTIVSRVVTIQTSDKTLTETNSLLEKTTFEALEEISEIDNPAVFLDGQMRAGHQLLITQTNNGDLKLSRQTAEFIEKCAKTKEQIEANVNGKFALINLILDAKLASK